MDIKHNLLPAQKSRKYNLKETIDLYPITTELYNELGRIGIIARIKDIPQLGVIKVKKKLNKSRYDYVMLQLYLHQLIRKNIQQNLKFSYSNYIKIHIMKKLMNMKTLAKISELSTSISSHQ